MSKILKILAAIVILLIIALGVFISTFDVNQYKGDIIKLVEQKTGRNFDIGGNLKLGFSLIPTVIVEDVKFGNADWGSAPEMISVKYFEAQVGLIPLLSGNISVNRLVLDSPEILLETNKQGQGNWVFATGAKSKPDKTENTNGTPPKLDINEVNIKSAKVTYKDGVTGKTTKVDIDELKAEAGSFAKPVELLLRAKYNEIPVKVDGTIGSLDNLTNNKNFPLNIKASVNDTKLSLNGKIDQPMDARGIDVDVNFDADSLETFEKISGKKLPKTGPIHISGNVSEKDGAYFIKAMQAEVGKAKAGIDGKITNPKEAKGLDFIITFETDTLTNINGLAGTKLPAIGPIKLTTKLADKDNGYQLSDLKFIAGKTDLTGSALINLKGNRPALTASLSSNLVDLVPFASEKKEKVKKKKVFSSDTLPFDALKSADVKLDIKAKQIKTADLTMTNVNMVMNLKNGKLAISPLNAGVGEGSIALNMNLDASNSKTAKMNTEINVKNFHPSTLPDFKEKFKDGKTDATINVRGNGKSVAAIMAGLNGKFLAQMGPGTLKSSATSAATTDLFTGIKNAVYGGKDSGGDTQIVCGVVNLKIKDGIATADKGIAISTKKMNVIGSGIINLKTEELDIAIDPQAREGVGISVGKLAELVKIGGTLAEPKAVPSTEAALKAAASVGTAVATGGLSIITGGLFDKDSNTDSDPCAIALGIAPKTKASSTTTTTTTEKKPKSVTEKATDTVKDAGTAIKDTFKGLFGD